MADKMAIIGNNIAIMSLCVHRAHLGPPALYESLTKNTEIAEPKVNDIFEIKALYLAYLFH